jgi:hypothetical protein
MNSIMERWVQTGRHELLDRTLIWNQPHLPRALREFEHFLQRAPAAPGQAFPGHLGLDDDALGFQEQV